MSETIDRGLLDLTVRLSTREITAGKQFAVFVLVKNPFARPGWIERVHVSLPSELLLADDNTPKELAEQKKDEEERLAKAKADSEALRKGIDQLQQSINAYETTPNSPDVKTDLWRLQKLLEEYTPSTNLSIHKANTIGYLRIESSSPNISIHGEDGKSLEIGSISILDPNTANRVMTSERRVNLRSSLPEGVPLQPSSTAVYTVLLNVKRSLIFPPSSYFLQFSVNFSFEKPDTSGAGMQGFRESLMTNTVSHEIAIRPSVYFLIGGATIGGVSGSVARLLKLTGQFDLSALTWSGGLSSGFTIALAVILSAVSIIFVARKSEAQSFISVEDFWGGLLIGFFVGYTGTEFFSDLTRVKVTSSIAPGSTGVLAPGLPTPVSPH